jgi:methionyl-tRNA formyltransferase
MGHDDFTIANLKTLVVGCTPLARKVVRLLEDSTDLVGVVNLHPEVAMGKSNYDSISDFAKRRSCDVHWTKDINDEATKVWMTNRAPEVIVQCGWSQIFKPHVLNIPSKYCIGIHPSPLPKGRGAAVLNWKLIESGGKEIDWGNSLFIMRPKTDTGSILDYEPFTIELRDDIKTLYHKVERTALAMLSRSLPKVCDGSIELTPQDNSQKTRYYKRSPKDGMIELSWSATKICDHVRALTHPYPGAFIQSEGQKIFVWKASRGAWRRGERGQVLEIRQGKGFLLKVGGNDTVWIERISVDGIEQWADRYAISRNLKRFACEGLV